MSDRIRTWTLAVLLVGSMVVTDPADAGGPGADIVATPAKVLSFSLPEVTAVAIPPGNPQCPDGRLVFASGVDLARTTLGGDSAPPVPQPAQILLTPIIGDPSASPIYDAHMVSLSDGTLIHTVEGKTWRDIRGAKPQWWEQSVEYPADQKNEAGARGIIWVFRSADCGDSWTLAGSVDAGHLEVVDPVTRQPVGAKCGVLRRRLQCTDGSDDLTKCPQAANQVKFSVAGGWDGHYLAVDPASDLLVISTPCYFGTDVNKEDSFQILAVSSDRGRNWKSTVSFPRNQFRGPVAAVGDGKWAYAWRDDQSIRLTIDDPVTGTFSKSVAVAPFFNLDPALRDTFLIHTGPIDEILDLAINPVETVLVPSSTNDHKATPVVGSLPKQVLKPLPPVVSLPKQELRPRTRSIVQVSSPTWSSSDNALALQVQNVNPATDEVTQATERIESSANQQSVLLGSFIQGNRVSLLYWFEEASWGKYRVRYQVYQRGKALLSKNSKVLKGPELVDVRIQTPGTILQQSGTPYELSGDTIYSGAYMKGSHFVEAGVERFFLFWNDLRNVAFAEVRVSNLPADPEQ